MSQLVLEGEPVWVLDSSALINMKSLISASDQWDAFKRLERLVEQRRIAMPRQVIREVTEITHPDLPGAWAAGVRGRLHHPLDVEYEHIQRVMREAGDVVDPNKATEEADPYVLALALQLLAQGIDATVVTDDTVDHLPVRIALTTACDRLGIGRVECVAFLGACGIATRGGSGESAGAS